MKKEILKFGNNLMVETEVDESSDACGSEAALLRERHPPNQAKQARKTSVRLMCSRTEVGKSQSHERTERKNEKVGFI